MYILKHSLETGHEHVTSSDFFNHFQELHMHILKHSLETGHKHVASSDFSIISENFSCTYYNTHLKLDLSMSQVLIFPSFPRTSHAHIKALT